ncbi:MAG: hypothetical protein SFV52_02020 [Saprospiraceae bacterium]|nr:hypothetical protein [Saprospiraceae bacterium]
MFFFIFHFRTFACSTLVDHGNLFLALKLSRNAELARKNWKKIFTFGDVLENELRAQMFFQTLTLYIYIVSGMSQGAQRMSLLYRFVPGFFMGKREPTRL